MMIRVMMLYLALITQKPNDILLLSQLTFMSNINMKRTPSQIRNILGKFIKVTLRKILDSCFNL